MTLPTYPTEMFNSFDLRPGFRQAAGALGSGKDFVVSRGKPAWTLKLRTPRLSVAEIGLWEAFEVDLEGAANLFLGWHPMKEFPQAYRGQGPDGRWCWPIGMRRHDGDPFDGTVEVTSISPDRRSVVLSACPAGLILMAGDHLGFEEEIDETARYSLHVVKGVTVKAASDGTMTVTFGYPLPSGFSADATVRLHRACGKFRKTGLQLPITADGGERPGDVTLDALSVNV